MIQSLLGSLDLTHTESSEKPYTIPGTIPIKLADIHEWVWIIYFRCTTSSDKDRKFLSLINNCGCLCTWMQTYTCTQRCTFSFVYLQKQIMPVYVCVHVHAFSLQKEGLYSLYMKHNYLLRNMPFLIQTGWLEYTWVYFLHLVQCFLGWLPSTLQLAAASLCFCDIPEA